MDVQRDANDVVQTAYLAPAANLDSFELALVITDYEGGLPPVDQQPVPCGEDGDGARGRGALLHADARPGGHAEAHREAVALRARADRPRPALRPARLSRLRPAAHAGLLRSRP